MNRRSTISRVCPPAPFQEGNDRMSSAITGKSTTSVQTPSPNNRAAGALFLSPCVCGPALTVGFYVLLSQLPQQADSVTRYFGGNWILYAETGLFFVGVAQLLRKALGL